MRPITRQGKREYDILFSFFKQHAYSFSFILRVFPSPSLSTQELIVIHITNLLTHRTVQPTHAWTRCEQSNTPQHPLHYAFEQSFIASFTVTTIYTCLNSTNWTSPLCFENSWFSYLAQLPFPATVWSGKNTHTEHFLLRRYSKFHIKWTCFLIYEWWKVLLLFSFANQHVVVFWSIPQRHVIFILD